MTRLKLLEVRINKNYALPMDYMKSDGCGPGVSPLTLLRVLAFVGSNDKFAPTCIPMPTNFRSLSILEHCWSLQNAMHRLRPVTS